LRRAALAVAEKEPGATRLAAMAKRLTTDAGFEVVNGCLQLHGGYGYLRDHPIERILRDVRVHQILEGTNEVMRLIESRDILGNLAPRGAEIWRSPPRRPSRAPPSMSTSPNSRPGCASTTMRCWRSGSRAMPTAR